MPQSTPTPLTKLTPELVQSLQNQAETILSNLYQENSVSTYFREAELLSQFRQSLAIGPATPAKAGLFEKFCRGVPFSSYADYFPFIQRFFATPCKASTVNDLFAPGLPYFIAISTGTSSGKAKYFPKYKHTLPDAFVAARLALQNKVTSLARTLTHSNVMRITDDNSETSVAELPVCVASTGIFRMYFGLDISKDKEIMDIHNEDETSPLAVMYISIYPTLMFMHVLFALANRNLQVIDAMFSSYFRDYCRVLEDKCEDMVDIIESGTIPDMPGLEHVKIQLQARMKANPDRAAELRTMRKTDEAGWLKKLWPNLETIKAICSGPFGNVVPELRHFIGPDVCLHSMAIGSSEALLALAYDPNELNLFKIFENGELIEFLDVTSPEMAGELSHSWDVVPGRKYELVVTTRDGLWRYRMYDIVEIVGFDPRDGLPVVRYGERRGVEILGLTESQLRASIGAISELGTSVSEFCVAYDYRGTIPRHSFFVELQGEIGTQAHAAPKQLLDHLCGANGNYRSSIESQRFGPPNIRVLRHGTFYEFREWRTRVRKLTSLQLKVPVVAWDRELINWLEERVVDELKVMHVKE